MIPKGMRKPKKGFLFTIDLEVLKELLESGKWPILTDTLPDGTEHQLVYMHAGIKQQNKFDPTKNVFYLTPWDFNEGCAVKNEQRHATYLGLGYVNVEDHSKQRIESSIEREDDIIRKILTKHGKR